MSTSNPISGTNETMSIQDEFRASKGTETHVSQDTSEKEKVAAVSSKAITLPPSDLERSREQIREESQTNDNTETDVARKQDRFLAGALPIALTSFATVFAIVSLLFAGIANDQSMVANQIALLSLCAGNLSSNFCSDLLDQVDSFLPSIASHLYSISPTLTPSSTKSSGSISTTTAVTLLGSKGGFSAVNPFMAIFIVFSTLLMLGFIFGLAYWERRRGQGRRR